MSSLWKRANARQQYMLRIVAGAVKNAADAHKEEIQINEKFARSVAKRAVGTLTAQWPKVLATKNGRQNDREIISSISRSRGVLPVPDTSQRGIIVDHGAPRNITSGYGVSEKGTVSPFPMRSPLRKVWMSVASSMRKHKHKNPERYQELIEALRHIDAADKILRGERSA